MAISIANGLPKKRMVVDWWIQAKQSHSGGRYKPSKPISSLKKKFIKGAVLGAGAYVGYKAAKMAGKFATSALTKERYNLDEWNNWRRADGMLCQNTDDCSWINHKCTARI